MRLKIELQFLYSRNFSRLTEVSRQKVNPLYSITTFIGCDKDDFFLPPFNYYRLHGCSIFVVVIIRLNCLDESVSTLFTMICNHISKIY